jgi:hypothetical protein
MTREDPRSSMSPEETAARWLERVSSGTPALPVDVDHLAEEVLGLDVQEHADLRALIDASDAPPGELSGLLLPGQDRIYVNAVEARRSRGRRRFTVAHELGHWHLHRDGDDVRTRFCRPADIGAGSSELWAARTLEAEANRFAAALLMPADLVRREAAACRYSVPVLARQFDVSVIAMQVRLEVLNLLPSYMRR